MPLQTRSSVTVRAVPSPRRRPGRWLALLEGIGRIALRGPRSPRTLRWVFSRAGEMLTFELALKDGAEAYELHSSPAYPVSLDGIERFSSVDQAFQRQSEIEDALLGDGWILKYHQSVAC